MPPRSLGRIFLGTTVMSKAAVVSATDPADADKSAKERILEGSLRIFAERGFQTATLREITDLVAVNIAAVNYYYGSKDALIRAVLIRYVRPIVDARHAALDELEGRQRRASVREVVETLVWPMVRFSRDTWGGRSVVQLLLQTRAIPRPEFQDIVGELFDPIGHRFVDAFLKASPRLGRAEAYWRYNFALGAIMQVLTDSNPATRRLEALSGGLCPADDKAIAAQLVNFISAGIAADARAKSATRARRTPTRRNSS
jgi:AcrR family transcriptional regulator